MAASRNFDEPLLIVDGAHHALVAYADSPFAVAVQFALALDVRTTQSLRTEYSAGDEVSIYLVEQDTKTSWMSCQSALCFFRSMIAAGLRPFASGIGTECRSWIASVRDFTLSRAAGNNLPYSFEAANSQRSCGEPTFTRCDSPSDANGATPTHW
jgi:hypothetical protein